MKRIWLLITLLISNLLLIGCFNNIEKSTDTLLFEQLKESFTWNIIDWTNLGIVDITWDNTLYYNDEFGIATVLWEEWKWYSIITERIADDFEYSWEIIQIQRPMIKIWKQLGTEDYNVNAYLYHYWFSIISNEDVEKIKTRPDVWNISFKEDYKWENNKYSFFETSARRWEDHRFLLRNFPNLDCNTWTETTNIDWNTYEVILANCNWYEVIDWEAVKTRKSWIEQLFAIWFLFFDIN